MATQNFYDIHFHAMNLAHPNILAFARRIHWQWLSLVSPLAPFMAVLGGGRLKKVKNLLAVMENDIGSFFMLVEYYLREQGTLQKDVFRIDDQTFDRIVLTPLLMDFGYKNIRRPDTYYRIPPQKPIISQVEDVFNGISAYFAKELRQSAEGGGPEYWLVPRTSQAVFEIYPFLGLNTKNYGLNDLQKMLDKYFADYEGDYVQFRANLGKFAGRIDDLKSNFFAGVKLYPPIGFDPWPDDAKERAKAEYLYEYCCAKEIPITVHCSDGGFKLDENAALFTSPERWSRVLSQARFAGLKLNFAHFGKQHRKKYLFFTRHDWRDRIVRLIQDHPNVYADFSYIGTDDGHYRALEEACAANPFLRERLLFGSDFLINLLKMESYNGYLEIFAKTPAFYAEHAAQKKAFCTVNPERFLWRK